jgi:hypothetical protein
VYTPAIVDGRVYAADVTGNVLAFDTYGNNWPDFGGGETGGLTASRRGGSNDRRYQSVLARGLRTSSARVRPTMTLDSGAQGGKVFPSNVNKAFGRRPHAMTWPRTSALHLDCRPSITSSSPAGSAER